MKEHAVPIPEGRLAVYETGRGRPILFLHGGPGDTHDYLREVAVELSGDFRCILFDQRGTGRSDIRSKDSVTLGVEKFISDIDAILDHFGFEEISLFGHSWGAILGLLYAIERNAIVSRAALVSMGPLTAEYAQLNSDRSLAPLTETERREFTRLRAKRSLALERGEQEEVKSLDREMMFIRVRAWVVNPALHSRFLDEYFSQPPPDRFVSKTVWNSFGANLDLSKAGVITKPVWLCQGRQDATPLEQALELQRNIPGAQLSILDECGHIPWLEKPQEFYESARRFFT